MEYLANFKPPKQHVLQEDILLESVAEEQFLEWQEKWEKAKECQITLS
jgi:hypothetical protein